MLAGRRHDVLERLLDTQVDHPVAVVGEDDIDQVLADPLFSGVFHTSREGFMTRKERKPASNMVAWISSQTLPSKIKKYLITNKVTTNFLISLCTPISYAFFLRPTAVSRFKN